MMMSLTEGAPTFVLVPGFQRRNRRSPFERNDEQAQVSHDALSKPRFLVLAGAIQAVLGRRASCVGLRTVSPAARRAGPRRP